MADTILTKTCRTCREEKPLVNFYSRADRPSYRSPDCIDCEQAKIKIRRIEQITTFGYTDAPVNPIGNKECSICGEIKSLSDFHWRRDWHAFRAECKSCYRKKVRERIDPIDNRRRVREWIKANPEKRQKQSRRNHENRRVDVGRWLASNLRTTRAYCKRKGVPIDITASDLVALFHAENGRCALTGREMIFGSKGQQRDSISVDRIKPERGYVLGNVRLVTYQTNMARGPYSDDELFAFCEAVLATREASR